MYLFAAPLPAAERKNASAYVRALLARAYREVWGETCPPVAKDGNGRPYFPERPDRQCSLSHSKTYVLAALSEHAVGADVETLRPIGGKVRDRLFTPEERRDFTLFEGWTLRESVYKLTGQSSLLDLRLRRDGAEIAADWPGVRCRLYADVPGCAAAAACFEGEFPARIKLVGPAAFWPCKTEESGV